MASDSASRPPLGTPPAALLALVGFATCPSCHTVNTTVTDAAVDGGADWHCARCGQRWDATRLAAVAAYAQWLSTHIASSDDRSPTSRGNA